MQFVRAMMARSIHVMGITGLRDNVTSEEAILEVEGDFLHVATSAGSTWVPLGNVLFLWQDNPSTELKKNVGQSEGTKRPSQTPPTARPVKKAKKPDGTA